jgi:rod shape-determining protein MreB
MVFNEPTCVTWQKTSQQVLNFGRSAYNLLGKISDQVEVVFPLAKNKVNQTGLLAIFLKSALAKAVSTATAHPKHLSISLGVASELSISHAVILKQLMRKTPLVSTVRLIPRIEAAYLSLFQQKKVSSQACLILLGEASTEIGVFAQGKLVVTSQANLSKDSLISLVCEQIRIVHQLEIGHETAEQVWEEIAAIDAFPTGGEAALPKRDLQMVIRGKHILTHLPTTAQVSTHDLVAGIGEAMVDLLQAIKQAFDQVSPELMGGLLEKGLTVTGSINIRGLDNYLEDQLHCPVVISGTARQDVLTGLLLVGKTRR